MGVFAYEALDKKGKKRKGVLEADSARQLRQQLRSEGLAPVSIAESEQKSSGERASFSLFEKKASPGEVAMLTRQLATLVAASIPLEECLQALSRQVQKSHLKTMITTVRAKVLEGRTLAESLAIYPKTFDTLYCSMVAAGEKSGHLDTVLERLADYTEQRQVIRGKLIQAMIYPAILTIVAVSVIAVLLATVVPTVVEQFADLGQDLPGMTLALIAMSDFVRDYGFAVLGGLVALLFLRQRLLVNPKRRLTYDRIMLKMPVIGEVGAGVDTSRFARTLSILSSSSVPLLDGMRISAEVMSNSFIRKALEEASERVREGSSLWIALDKTQLFPPMMLHIIASGEKSGELEQMLGRAADSQDRQFENQVNIALGVFGPLLIVSMAGMVLFIVMAILTPMLDLNSLVSG
ncbi:type II secretion system inner membrane protein GspF [Endozoicomonas numazuensis]|uniref:General secretion pathway protein F n=1 Tax=Endozoicomonas numazuensis TaxID=1137799 RepID=A0A081NJ62_9GAMM|nr:type II secretion system inner membrane protein GspF [Endozoicomonas numazuensis]KEQ18485.1 general secretion pathway protein GspF [Endozoicomonas numazuensis]